MFKLPSPLAAVERIGTNKPVTASFWPWLEPFSARKSLKSIKWFVNLLSL